MVSKGSSWSSPDLGGEWWDVGGHQVSRWVVGNQVCRLAMWRWGFSWEIIKEWWGHLPENNRNDKCSSFIILVAPLLSVTCYIIASTSWVLVHVLTWHWHIVVDHVGACHSCCNVVGDGFWWWQWDIVVGQRSWELWWWLRERKHISCWRREMWHRCVIGNCRTVQRAHENAWTSIVSSKLNQSRYSIVC